MIPNCGEYAPQTLTGSSFYRGAIPVIWAGPYAGSGVFALVPVLEEKYYKQR